MMRFLRALVFPAVMLGALEWWGRTIGRGSDALAPPSAAFQAFLRAVADSSVVDATLFTLGSAAAGLGAAFVLALILGSALGLSRRLSSMGFLTIEMLRPIPAIALFPLATLFWGFGFRMELAVTAFACFWPLLILTQAAVRQIDPRLLEVSMALELSPTTRFLKILVPSIVPRLFVALRQGVAISLVVAVTAEIAVNPHGMGYALMNAQQNLDPALMLAWLFWISLVGFSINFSLGKLEQRLVLRLGGAA